MIKVDRLRYATSRALERVEAVAAAPRSSYMDIAPNLARVLTEYSQKHSRTQDTPENRAFFRQYFRALNDYMSMINDGGVISQKERFGDVLSATPECALPEVRGVDSDDLYLLMDVRPNPKLVYIELLGANRESLEEVAA